MRVAEVISTLKTAATQNICFYELQTRTRVVGRGSGSSEEGPKINEEVVETTASHNSEFDQSGSRVRDYGLRPNGHF